jgi:hypothetical protein
MDGISRREVSRQDLLGQRILEALLNDPLERPGALDRIEADIAQQVQGLIRDLQGYPLIPRRRARMST